MRRVDSRDEASETGRSSARPPASRRQGPKAGGSTSDPQSRIADPLRGSRCWRPPGIIHHPTTHDPLRKHIISPAGRSTPLALHHDAERQAARGLSMMTADVLSSKDTPVPFALSVVSYPRSPSARRHLDALRSAMGATPGAGASRHQWRRCQSPITSRGNQRPCPQTRRSATSRSQVGAS